CLLCLLKRVMAHSQDKENAVNTLSTLAMKYLQQVEGRHQESARLTEAFNKYRYAYHTGYISDGSQGPVMRKWLCGTMRFEVFVSHLTSDELPVWFIKATHEIRGRRELEQRVFMFGRVRSRQGSGRMSWFATSSGNQQRTVRITFSHDHLN